MKLSHILTLIVCLFVLSIFPSFAIEPEEETVVVGQILSKGDRIPLANASIYFKGSDKATRSNEEGYFMIRSREKYKTLIFSCIGFKQAQIHVRQGQSVGIEVTLEEIDNQLDEVFVLPGTNPALELMRRVRAMRSLNDRTNLAGFSANLRTQELVLMDKMKLQFSGKHIYNQLKKGNIAKNDSALVVPLYMAETNYLQQGKSRRQNEHRIFSSPRPMAALYEKMTGELAVDLNLYQNSFTILGKSMISPLATIGGAFYDYYLADSVNAPTGKQYLIHFRTKNKKNLAFDGKMKIDSASLALVSIEAELPDQANINFIHNLKISQTFRELSSHCWVPQNYLIALRMSYQVAADSSRQRPELLIKQTADYSYSDSVKSIVQGFAQSQYDTLSLNERLNKLDNTPIMRTAKWIADAALTGYMKFGKMDIGTIPLLARTTDTEGLRLNLPMRTNEDLWKHFSLGGYIGYGTKNHAVRYSATTTYRVPGHKWHTIEMKYTDDARRIDYNYNNFINTENPLNTGDEDLFSTILTLWSADKLNRRKEFETAVSKEWTPDLESALYFRYNQIYSAKVLPMSSTSEQIHIKSIYTKSLTLNTRLSFDERTYEDHIKRIYIANNLPVCYFIVEAGQYKFGGLSGLYAKTIASLKQIHHFELGTLNYIAEVGKIWGKVPYPILHFPAGTEASGYGLNQVTPTPVTGSGGYSLTSFNMMKYMEYGSDLYMDFCSEFISNGWVMNHIPYVKYLNLRETASFKIAYGRLSSVHQSLLSYPDFMQAFNQPYVELGVGITNILHFLTIQSVWRLTDLDHPNVKPWGLRVGFKISF